MVNMGNNLRLAYLTIGNADTNWKEICPGLPEVESVRHEGDSTIWMRWHDSDAGVEFYVTGFTKLDLYGPPDAPGPLPDEKGRYFVVYEPDFFGLVVSHRDRTMFWAEIFDEYLRFRAPSFLEMCVDSSWEPRRSREVMAQWPDYGVGTQERTSILE